MPVNIGNPYELSILEFARTINEIIGNKAGITHMPALRVQHDPEMRQPDITRAKEILKWNPEVSLDEGIRKTVPYFQRKMGLA